MISLILPYWLRQEAADMALALLDQHYAGMDLEVVIVDDGSPEPFRTPQTRLNIKVVRLPTKKWPKSPCLCWNEGVKAASGEVIALSCIEVLHEQPVLAEMLAELERTPNGYILAAAWCPEQQAWHTHSTVEVPECPKGTGLAFLGLMKRELYERAGGWDEEYRDGAGYEDRDFIHHMTQAGAVFVKRDDLVVTHPKTGASIAWGEAKFARNKALFERKWPRKVTFACLNARNYCGRGAEYVNKLYDMICKHMPSNVVFRFVCLTDDETGLNEDIETIPLPRDLEGWYGKLYLFKQGLFPDGDRVIFMDLDTLIIGSLDDLVNYDGPFATLNDFYFPQQVGPAIMAWKAGGVASTIWREWDACGRPRDVMGDLWWINNLDEGRFAHRADKLQALFPGQFVSFKAHCKPNPPKGARVICFHGKPRPHEAEPEWVGMVWDGHAPADLEVVCNTDQEKIAANIQSACKRDLPWLPLKAAHEGEIAIVAGGPSLPQYLDELKGKKIVAVNGAHDYLLSKGIAPDVHLIIDARPENAAFITTPAKEYWLASQCDPAVFDKAKNVTVVHMNTADVLDSIPMSMKPINLISSGSTVGLAGMAIAYCLGYRKLYVYGMDSSYDSARHAYPQSLNDEDRAIEAIVGGRTFKCAPWMIAQAQQFQTLSAELIEGDCEIYIRCNGLLGHMAWTMMNDVKHAA